MGTHRDSPGTSAERPTFDEVARGYDPHQVDDYLATLWRYASQVTSRAAEAEAALRVEVERREAESRMAKDGPSAQAGGRIGLMLAIAEQEADEIITGARRIAERALGETIEDSAANHPIVREAREQADKLLLDAVEESRRRAKRRHSEIEAQIARSMASLETLRHQQGEILGAMLRLRGLLGSPEIDRAVAELARSGMSIPEAPPPAASPSPPPPPPMPPPSERRPGRAHPGRDHDVADAEVYPDERPIRTATAYRPGHDDDILDAEVVEE